MMRSFIALPLAALSLMAAGCTQTSDRGSSSTPYATTQPRGIENGPVFNQDEIGSDAPNDSLRRPGHGGTGGMPR
jgi:hypothetical protein